MSSPDSSSGASNVGDAGQAGSNNPPPPAPQRDGTAKRYLQRLLIGLLVASIVVNVYLGLIVSSFFSGSTESTAYAEGDSSHPIVVIPVEGLINSETDEFIRNALRTLEEDVPEAIVLRINTGGGGVGASDRIWTRLRRFKQETGIPIVASFGDTAASGGYYVATPADQIYAETTSLTGSIGVMGLGFTLEEMLDKLGVTPEVLVANDSPRKDWFSFHQPWTEEEREHRRALLDDAYERFVEVIVEERGDILSESEVRELATGEVYTAGQAHANELVDEIGYLEDAIDAAAELADIPENVQPDVQMIRPRQAFGLGSLVYNPQAGLDDISAGQVRDWLTELQTPRMMYHMGW